MYVLRSPALCTPRAALAALGAERSAAVGTAVSLEAKLSDARREADRERAEVVDLRAALSAAEVLRLVHTLQSSSQSSGSSKRSGPDNRVSLASARRCKPAMGGSSSISNAAESRKFRTLRRRARCSRLHAGCRANASSVPAHAHIYSYAAG